MFNNIKAVIFDMDGTLIDSMWMWRQIDEDYLHSKGCECPDDIQRRIEGMCFSETAEYIKKAFNIDDTPEQMMDAWNSMAYDFYKYKVPYKPGAEKFLQYLKKNGYKTGIATSNSGILLEAVLDSLKLRDYIDEIHTASEVAKGKPAPDVYLHVAKCLGVEPENCLVFEDVVNGIKAGKAAGMRVCGVDDDYSADMVEEKKQLADFYIHSFEELKLI